MLKVLVIDKCSMEVVFSFPCKNIGKAKRVKESLMEKYSPERCYIEISE